MDRLARGGLAQLHLRHRSGRPHVREQAVHLRAPAIVGPKAASEICDWRSEPPNVALVPLG